LLAGALVPQGVQAYCRTTTVAPTQEQVRTQECVTKGYPLYWPDLEIHYGFNPNRASEDLDDATVREVYARGFAQWAKVTCSDGSPGFDFVEDQEPYSEREPTHVLGQMNVNAMLFRPASEWQPENLYPGDAYALTGVWYDTNSGRMLGADMEINEGRGPYAVCPDSGCEHGESDLGNVVTHEIGHMIGFAHSEVADATMYFNAPPGQVSKRSLEDDDKSAVCAVYSPSAVLAREPDEEEGGCSVTAQRPVTSSASWALGMALGALLVRRRRRA
jgi:MYXO-CTERM domain-containing protein